MSQASFTECQLSFVYSFMMRGDKGLYPRNVWVTKNSDGMLQLPRDAEVTRVLSFPSFVHILAVYCSEKKNGRVTWGGTGVPQPTFGLVQFGVYGRQRSLHGFGVLWKGNPTVILSVLYPSLSFYRGRYRTNTQQLRQSYNSFTVIPSHNARVCQNATPCMQSPADSILPPVSPLL